MNTRYFFTIIKMLIYHTTAYAVILFGTSVAKQDTLKCDIQNRASGSGIMGDFELGDLFGNEVIKQVLYG
ncbi:MAG: hypothetical protein ACTTH7_05000 [Treponema sp.]